MKSFIALGIVVAIAAISGHILLWGVAGLYALILASKEM
jgi:hypothetical protein